jgi:CBS domain-containing protein
VGYGVIQKLVTDDYTWKLLLGVLLVKSAIWTFSLGSNTSGGILAPLMMIGGALGAVLGHVFTPISQGAWSLVGMTAMLSAAIGAPLTSAMMAVELTHNGGLMLPVLLACIVSYAVSVLLQPRSILTERLSRRGLHLSREYGVDPLETVMVSQAMHTSVFALPADATRADAAEWLRDMESRGGQAWSHWQRVFPLLDADGRMRALLTRSQMITAARKGGASESLVKDGNETPHVMLPTDTLRQAASVMADLKLTAFPVVDPDGKFAGILTIDDLLTARSKEAMREGDRQRVLQPRWPFGRRGRGTAQTAAAGVSALDGEPAAQGVAATENESRAGR